MAQFKPGQSGNPSGRPKQKPFLDWCKKWTVEKAEKFLIPIAEKVNKNQLEAIKMIMAYGVGKPVETQIVDAEITDSTGSPAEAFGRGISDLLGRKTTGSAPADNASQVDARQ